MRPVLLLLGAAILVFMTFTAYSVRKQIYGSAELLVIKNTYFPVLQRLDANLVRVDKVQEIYAQVVSTGDRELLVKTNDVCAAADNAFKEIYALSAGDEADLAKLRLDLKKYEEIATTISLALLDSPDADISARSAEMIDALTDLKTRLAAERQSTYDRFVDTLATSQHNAATTLYWNLVLGLMNLGFIAVLVYFIRNNANMMTVIAEQNATLESRVAERTLQLNQKTHDINAMLQNMKVGVATIIPGNRIHPEYSSHLCTIFAMEDLEGRDFAEVILAKADLSVDVKDQVDAALKSILGNDVKEFDLSKEALVGEIRLQPMPGSLKTIQIDWSPIVNEHGCVDKVLVICQDVTQQKLLESELSNAKKLESIGQLSAGIAHEINTPTQFIGNNVGFLKDGVAEVLALVSQLEAHVAQNVTGQIASSELSALLASIDLAYLNAEIPRAVQQSLEGIDRIQQIVGAMKQFSHPAVDRTPVDINRAIESTVIVASNEWKYVAELETRFDPELPQVPVMPGMFNQVILNMIVNAAHAVQDANPDGNKKGKIIITTRRTGQWAEILIEDTGCGMPSEIRERIFDPFFTTKPVGKGTGQGLTIAHDVIVARHGGSIAVTSELNAGTIFVLRVPLALEPLSDDLQRRPQDGCPEAFAA